MNTRFQREQKLNPKENKVNQDAASDFRKLFEDSDESCVCQAEVM